MEPHYFWTEDMKMSKSALSVELGAEEKLKTRADGLQDWLNQECPECFSDQKHLHQGTTERAYWHYGYLCAVRDILRLFFYRSRLN
jgi:hypothetical protein